jgi:DNA-binding NtrC family response regulator
LNEMPPNPKPLLLVDDDTGLLRQLRWAFSDHKVFPAATRQEAIDFVKREPIPVAIVDLGLPPDPDGASEGLATLTEILAIAPATKVVIATGNETREHALRAIALGAYDFYQKPIDIDVLQLIVSRAERMFELEDENRRLAEVAQTSPVDGIIASSPEMLRGPAQSGKDGADRCYGIAAGRKRYRQGIASPGGAQDEPPVRRAIRTDQLRGDPRDPARK